MASDYWNLRAREYERIYHRDDPVRQAEQSAIADVTRRRLAGRRVLEVACGTGFWTEVVAQVAKSIVAVDVSPEMLAIAREKGLPPESVEFHLGDAFDLASIPGAFDAGLANFWFSHVPRARLDEFLDGFHARLGPGAVVLMADNVYVPGVGGELITRPGSEDAFKLRELSDGSKHEVLKNYYDREQLLAIFGPGSRDLQAHVGKCFWLVEYVVA